MSFDAHSLERLKALGRSLPRPLPAPEPVASKPKPRQHRLETEQNPEQLFRELMSASSDGTVPPHLLERLRSLEATAPAAARPAETTAPPGRPAGRGSTGGRGGRRPGPADGERELYEAFADLLNLEADESDDVPAPRAGRPTDDRLKPKPADRPRRPGEA